MAGGLIMEFIRTTFWGVNYYQHQLDEKHVAYMEFAKELNRAEAGFVMGLPGGTVHMTKEESLPYRLGIEGDVITNIGEHPEFVNVHFTDTHENFADIYNKDGQVIKNLLIKDGKIFKKADDGFYYEVKSDKDKPGINSVETFVENYQEHKCELKDETLEKKERYAKLFMELLDELLN